MIEELWIKLSERSVDFNDIIMLTFTFKKGGILK